ncbi:helix-turn-helix domain-containing protein [Ruminococcaceae bacterium OttesenSCG-928-L11]|nr:helix-turn-helix domain-containing protein [Ruminococcaceae bacterium OttesenSCG-928-L11]
MNVLLVDDQRAIVESLKKGIRWETIPVEKVYTACSAREAKMVLRNFEVDVLVTDIEMPEEDGLSLFRWTKEAVPDVEGVFLTSHADFNYAQNAIHMGGFDYILQPVKYTDVEDVLRKVWEKIKDRDKIRRLENTKRLVQEQKNHILDGLIHKVNLGKEEAANQLFRSFPELFQMESEELVAYPILVEVLRWKGEKRNWDEKLVRLVFCNVIEELFEAAKGNVAASAFREDRYCILLVVEKGRADTAFYRQGIEEFYQFVESNMDFQVGVYPAGETSDENFTDIFVSLNRRADENTGRKNSIFWKDSERGDRAKEEDVISLAKAYIRRNVSKNIARGDVADHVHLNEEYFSKLFRQQTGYTFKDYVMMEKMNAAKALLKESRLSISIIASKVGYDNFSHFSKMFKKLTNQTPQEYRKENQ